jgi:hypothetical protein
VDEPGVGQYEVVAHRIKLPVERHALAARRTPRIRSLVQPIRLPAYAVPRAHLGIGPCETGCRLRFGVRGYASRRKGGTCFVTTLTLLAARVGRVLPSVAAEGPAIGRVRWGNSARIRRKRKPQPRAPCATLRPSHP